MPIYLIRHAESEFNVAKRDMLQQEMLGHSPVDTLRGAKLGHSPVDTLRGAKLGHSPVENNAYLACNSPLSSHGITQAEKLGSDLRHVKFDVMFVSPLKRAIQTYEYAKFEPKLMVIEPLIREFRQDSCDFFEDEPQILETDDELKIRVDQMWEILKQRKEETIGVICHGDFIWRMSTIEVEGEMFGNYLDNAEYKIFN